MIEFGILMNVVVNDCELILVWTLNVVVLELYEIQICFKIESSENGVLLGWFPVWIGGMDDEC